MGAWIRQNTVTVTNGTTTVTGAGTTWAALVRPGYTFTIDFSVVYEVVSVDSNTQITLDRAYAGSTASGASYAILPMFSSSSEAATNIALLVNTLLANYGAVVLASNSSPNREVVLDKSTAGATARMLIKQGGTAMWAFGAVGDNELYLQRSMDGTNWINVIKFTRSTGAINFLGGVTQTVTESDLASATTTDIGGTATGKVNITGTTTITSFGSAQNSYRFVRFAGALTLTYNATSLKLPGAADILTATGDTAIASSDASGNWTVRHYQRASGKAVVLSAADAPRWHRYGGQLRALHKALCDPLKQTVGIVLLGDSMTWGRTFSDNAVSSPRTGELSDPRDNYSTASWANNYKRYIGDAYFKGVSPVLSNFSPSASGEAIATFKKVLPLLYPGQSPFTLNTANTSVSASETDTAGAKLGRRYILTDGNTAGTSTIGVRFTFTGTKFKLWYTSIAASSCDYEIWVDGVLIDTYSSNSGGNANGLSREHTISYVYEKVVEIRLKRTGASPPNQTLQLEAIEIEKTCIITNQGIIGATARSYHEYMLSSNYPASSPANAVSAYDQFAFIQLGPNDRSNFNLTVSAQYNYPNGILTYKKVMGNILTRIGVINASVKPILMAPPPTTDDNPSTMGFGMGDVRDALVLLGEANSVDVIDNYAAFRGLTLSDYLPDGLHQNKAGHDVKTRNVIGAQESAF